MKVKVDYSNLPKGAEVQVHGLGLLENGFEYDITDADLDAYKAATGLERAPSSITLTDRPKKDKEHEEAQRQAEEDANPVSANNVNPVEDETQGPREEAK